MRTVSARYFSDVLCIWAYVAQARVEGIYKDYAGSVALDHRFCSVFGDARGKLAAAWQDRGGLEGYARHVAAIAARFPHVKLHPDTWSKVRPASSMSPHLFLAAVRLWERERISEPTGAARLPVFESVTWAFRRGFFAEGLDIAEAAVQRALAAPCGVPLDAIERHIADGTAFAALAADYADAEKAGIEGSPTFVLNEGRQKLYGNVGFRIIEANIKELLRDPGAGEASWC